MRTDWEAWLVRVSGRGPAADAVRKRIEWRSWDGEPEEASSPEVVWLGHASFRVRWRGVTLLFDPVFAKWIGLAYRIVPKPPLGVLRGADAALISHAHMDHLHPPSIQAVAPKRLIAPNKSERFLSGRIDSGFEMSLTQPGDHMTVGPLEIRVYPARHGGWRYPWQRGYTACSYLISDGERRLFWAGDTAYDRSLFRSIAANGPVDLALLPIGAYSPQRFLRKRHMNPEEAARSATELQAREVMPYHFGGYRLSLEPWDEPLRWFARCADERNLRWRLRLPFR